jgi:hypothetical protein
MSRVPMSRVMRPAFVALIVLLGAAAPSTATVCSTTPGVVFFTPTVDPTALNGFLALLGNQPFNPPQANVVIPGLCVDHQIALNTGVTHLPFGTSTFTVTPALGSFRVDLDLPGPYNVGVDGSNYSQAPGTCSSICVVHIPYIGDINGCNIESDIVRPVLGLLHASVTWDDVKATQIADTCVLPTCVAVNPLRSSTFTLANFKAHFIGSCNVCLPFFPNACLDPCSGIDSLIASPIQNALESSFNALLQPKPDEGLLIDVFANDIVHDFFCLDIPEVTACKNKRTPTLKGVVRGPRDHGLNAIFYSLPIGVAGVLAFRLRRRGSKPPA